MTDQTDLTIPLSQLVFDGDNLARATAKGWDAVQVGALLQHVIRRQAEQALKRGALFSVSVTFDVSADAATDDEIVFESRIDRRTRTLVFSSGTAMQGDRHLLKATIVYRIG
ncbi:MAG: hypothetical protein VXW22_00500 [Pseudomonadota bacterium]|jgi:hypothetical protein|nr:hypothetical protein [Pseudomonadota bacterium]